ncbi:MAG: RasGEF domain-containing protein [Parachlamydiaceae bacterium]
MNIYFKKEIRKAAGRFKQHLPHEISAKLSKIYPSTILEPKTSGFTAKVDINPKVQSVADEVLDLDAMMEQEISDELDLDAMMGPVSDQLLLTDFILGRGDETQTVRDSIGWSVQGQDLKIPLQKVIQQVNEETDPDKQQAMKKVLFENAKHIAARCFVGKGESRKNPCEEELRSLGSLLGTDAGREIEQLLLEKGLPKRAGEPAKAAKLVSLEKGIEKAAKKGKNNNLAAQIVQDMKNQHIHLFKSIDEREFMRLAWSKSEELSPNLKKLAIVQNGEMASMITSILRNPTGKPRSTSEALNMVRFYMDVLDKCIEEKDYFGAQAVFGALTKDAIGRLYNGDNALEKRLESALKLFSPSKNFANYSQQIASDNQNRRPFLPTTQMLTTLTYLHDGNEDKVHHHLNMKKMRMLQKELGAFSTTQKNLPEPRSLRTDLRFSPLENLSDQENYDLSLQVKPRT